MSRLILSSILGRKIIPLNSVTFSVKEWMLDPDNDLTDTEVGTLHYMTVKIDGVEQLSDANGQTTFNLTPGTHTYEVYDMVRYLTTVKGEVTVVDAAVAVGVKIYACLYTPTQVSEMISVDGYVPVASGTELDGLRNSVLQTMGAGTIWEDDYTTGLDKKYVQVANINLISFANWTGIGNRGNAFLGSYKGNQLQIYNFIPISQSYDDRTAGLFGVVSWLSEKNYISDVRLDGYCNFGANNLAAGMLINTITSTSNIDFRTEISDCTVSGIIDSVTALTGGVCGENGVASTGNYGGIIHDCLSRININPDGISAGDKGAVGGLVGYNRDGIIDYSEYLGDIIHGNRAVGGLVGVNSGSIETSYSKGDVYANSSAVYSGVGGLVGYNRGSIRKSHSSAHTESISSSSTIGRGVGGLVGIFDGGGEITASFATGNAKSNGGTDVGGLVGGAVYQSGQARTIENCYSTGIPSRTASSATVGGTIGTAISGTVIINTYYDSQTSGQSDTGKGLPRTTAQMKAGTADSFINPDGTIDATQDPDNAMYTDWDDTIWDFTDTNEYPTFL